MSRSYSVQMNHICALHSYSFVCYEGCGSYISICLYSSHGNIHIGMYYIQILYLYIWEFSETSFVYFACQYINMIIFYYEFFINCIQIARVNIYKIMYLYNQELNYIN